MPRTIKAALSSAETDLLTFETVSLVDPGPGEVVVQVKAAGICHTDIAALAAFPKPAILGHEGAGVVVETGPDCNRFKPGDRVVATFSSCGECPSCDSEEPAYCWRFGQHNFGGVRTNGQQAINTPSSSTVFGSFFQQSCFADHMLTTERNLVHLPDGVSFADAAPLGCGVQTGAGAVLNALAAGAGQSIAIFGAGAVGLSAVMAAKMAGCGPIIAIDVKSERLEIAQEFGADETLDGNIEDIAGSIKELTGGGAHFSLEASGAVTAFQQALLCLRPKGACCMVTAPTPYGETIPHPGGATLTQTRLIGCVEGDSVPEAFIPYLAKLGQTGDLPYTKLIRRYPFEKINDALADMKRGDVIKPVLTFDAQ